MFNPGTGQNDDPARVTLYTNQPCRIAAWQGTDRVVDAGEQPVSLRGYNVTLPVSVDDLEVDDWIEVTVSQDSYLVGKNLRVEDPKGSSLGVQRRITAELTLG